MSARVLGLSLMFCACGQGVPDPVAPTGVAGGEIGSGELALDLARTGESPTVDAATSDVGGLADLGGAPSPDLSSAAPSLTYRKDVRPLLVGNDCLSCHMTAAWNGVESAATDEAELSYLEATLSKECGADAFVHPGDATKSYLYQKVAGVGSCFTGDQMTLTSSEQMVIRDWINAGAPL
jgi:hypothetical protein